MRVVAIGWTLVLVLVLAPAASAEHNRYAPPGLDSAVTSTHFVVHYDPDTATAAAAQAFSADLEESHSRLVAGGGGTPSAGLNAPIADADGKTDAYMSRPSAPGWETFNGGAVFRDDHGAGASYMFMTPNLDRIGIRFRSAHEYMHVIQHAYVTGGGLLNESTANWASEFALPDIDPQDSNFTAPHLPLDCSYGTWPGAPADPACGNGYRQYPFIWRLTQRYGAPIVDALLDRMASLCPAGCSPSSDRQILSETIEAQPDAATLSSLYADYARDIWVPARWQSPAVAQFPTTAMQAIHNLMGLPAHTLVTPGTDDTGTQARIVDHLASRYVLYRTDAAYEPAGPDDSVEVTVTRPGNQTAPYRDLVWTAGGTAQDHFSGGGAGPHTFTLDADPAVLGRILVPLVNDSLDDGLTYTYRIRTIRGPATPPANDGPDGALTVARNSSASTNNVYAGGRGNVSEGTGCGPGTQDATRGVWFRFTADSDAIHSYDAAGSDFDAVIAVYDRATGQLISCSGAGQVNAFQRGGRAYDVYVGRWRNELGFGTQARLAVNGPDALLPEVNVNSPANGSVVGTNTPVFSGNASNRFGDADTVRILLWAGGDTSAPPTRTFTAPKVNTSWSVAAAPLPDGFYTWRAELDGKAGTGVTAPHTFTLRGPAGGPGELLDPPAPAAVTPDCRRARSARTAAQRKLRSARRALKRAKGARRRRAAKARVKRAQAGVRRANVRVRRFCL